MAKQCNRITARINHAHLLKRLNAKQKKSRNRIRFFLETARSCGLFFRLGRGTHVHCADGEERPEPAEYALLTRAYISCGRMLHSHHHDFALVRDLGPASAAR